MNKVGIVILMIGWFSQSLGAADISVFEVVNSRPQLTQNQSGFNFYFALWRTLADAERSELLNKSGTGIFVTLRSIGWKAWECKTSKLLRSDGERFWYGDPADLNSKGELIPNLYAQRPGYLYFVVLNLSSSRLRSAQPQTLNQSYGRVRVTVEQRLYTGADQPSDHEFHELADYKRAGHPLYSFYLKFAPHSWPVYYDERAHKPHTHIVPGVWAKPHAHFSKVELQYELEWNGCGEELDLVFRSRKSDWPKPGPTRPGRPDQGSDEVRVELVDKFSDTLSFDAQDLF